MEGIITYIIAMMIIDKWDGRTIRNLNVLFERLSYGGEQWNT